MCHMFRYLFDDMLSSCLHAIYHIHVIHMMFDLADKLYNSWMNYHDPIVDFIISAIMLFMFTFIIKYIITFLLFFGLK